MNILITIVLGLLCLVALVLIIALFTKKQYAIEEAVTISKPRQRVFNYVKYLKNQDHYNKWVMMDPNVRKEYKGTDGMIGFTTAWDSDNKNVGKGEQEIKQIKEGDRIDYEIRFVRPFKSTSPSYITTESVSDDSTKVKWGFAGKMSYPMNAMLLFINIPELLAKDVQTSLTNLKAILEKQ